MQSGRLETKKSKKRVTFADEHEKEGQKDELRICKLGVLGFLLMIGSVICMMSDIEWLVCNNNAEKCAFALFLLAALAALWAFCPYLCVVFGQIAHKCIILVTGLAIPFTMYQFIRLGYEYHGYLVTQRNKTL